METYSLLGNLPENARRLRKARGLSLAEVTSRMADLGMPLSLNGLSTIELGKRGADVDLIAALARALGVAPIELLFPLGHERAVELFPGTVVETWAALKWFTGEAPFPGSGESVEESPAAYFREQDRLIAEWHRIREGLTAARAQVGEEAGRPDRQEIRMREVRWFEDSLRAVEKSIRLYRAICGRDGVDLGELPPELAHVDRTDDGER